MTPHPTGLAGAAILALATFASLPSARAEGPAPSASAAEASPAMSGAELERVLARLADADPGARRQAAKAASELDVDAVPAIAQKLAELRRSGALVAAGVKAGKEHGRGEGGDLVEGLVQARGDAGAVRAALTTVCLLRSLARIGTTPAVRQLVLLSQDAAGALRPEVTRHVKALGERALAALIEARKDSPEARGWAATVLDGMGKRLPSDAVQTKNNQVLSDVLRAYGSVKDLDAVPVILSFVNSDRAQVRVAAREAIAMYGQDALWKLREAYTALTSKHADEGWSAAQLSAELFEAYDRFRLQEVYSLLDDGLKKHKDGDLKGAVDAFDKVLARQPMLDRRGEMVEGYAAYADTLADSDRTTALVYLRKAMRLEGQGARAKRLQSAVDYVEGMELLARGVADAELFRRAVALDPQNRKAEAQLQRMETTVEEKQSNLGRWLAAASVFVLAIGGIILFGGRRRRAARA